MEKVNTEEELGKIKEYWSPVIAAELNGQHVKFAKLKGEFPWHQHEKEDEMFFVIKGTITIEFRDKQIVLKENEFIVVPRGTEHRPLAENEASIMLFEPAATINTGNVENEYTKKVLKRI